MPDDERARAVADAAGPAADVVGVRVLELRDPQVRLRCRWVTRCGRGSWPPLALVLGALR